MSERSHDWLAQSRRDLAAARAAMNADLHEWACFAAHQAAEKAVKALVIFSGGEPWGHSITALLAGLCKRVPVERELLDVARMLDKHYIPTRYPNGFDTGAPGDYYTLGEAEQAIRESEKVIAFCTDRMAGP